MKYQLVAGLAVCGLALATISAGARPEPDQALSLRGTWVMESAYEIRADGTRTTTYGEHPVGLMMVDEAGRYSVQIYRPDRRQFKSGDKSTAEPDELREAVVGSSTHFGRVQADPEARQLIFEVQAAAFPNWEGKRQARDYTYANGVLTYRVPASASGSGTVAYSVWRKAGS